MVILHGVSKAYSGCAPIRVLEDVSLHVPSGCFAALVGPSGSGKSTIMNLIGLLDRHDSGQILLDGLSIGELRSDEAARLRNRLIGFVFQSFHLLPRMTAWENVSLPLLHRGVGRAERRAAAIAMLGRVGLADRTHHKPEQLSGGQRQRVAIARALVGQPKLILADEPTGNLDSGTGAQVLNLLRSLSRDLGVTILMVTHDREAACLCDMLVEIQDGQIALKRGV
ncbi:ABC transporter ATP-binding protein [Brevundimonas vesicularis]|uniref:ABC transporter ATP-binding protein n=1 Tax=Brevundimonas vesicularis TaxID=41276 RepID=UPI0038D4DDB6